jgi:ribosomal protein S18 acetylase RimI-like enzyme
MTSQLVRVTPFQKQPAAQLLARAFQDDPFMKFVVPEDAKRPGFLVWLLGAVVHYCALYGEVYATPDWGGVACWLPPGRTTLTVGRILQTGMWALRLKLEFAAARRFLANMLYTDKVHKEVMPAGHWYLWVLGVEPSRQGQGIGGKLIAPILEGARSSKVACYLETHNPKNLAFYGKYGFEVAREGKIPNRGLPVWALVKKP